MPAILFDYDVQGHFRVLSSIWTSEDCVELWNMLDCPVFTFRALQLPRELSDDEIWTLCQQRQYVLVTGNRNAKDRKSLEVAMRRLIRPDSLPVLTIADADRVMVDRQYATDVAYQIMEFVFDLEKYRGTRRLFVP
jgi:hypothetical protein